YCAMSRRLLKDLSRSVLDAIGRAKTCAGEARVRLNRRAPTQTVIPSSVPTNGDHQARRMRQYRRRKNDMVRRSRTRRNDFPPLSKPLRVFGIISFFLYILGIAAGS